MRIDEYQSLDATALAEVIARGDVSAGEVLDVAYAAIKAAEPALGAVVATCEEQAREQVAGLLPGVLAGVPYLIKDLACDVAGMATTNGSRLFADNIATRDSTLVTRLRAAGMPILGKTNTPEFGVGTSTEPALYGPTRNPWAMDRAAGGSSGGAAAAVAAGLVPVAHATDGGGSIRIPAACCGLFGLKPSRGRVTPGPDQGEAWAGMSIAHAVTRTVRDSATLLDITGAPEPGDPYHAPTAERPYAVEVGTDPGRLRIGLLLSAIDPDIEVDPECLRVTREAAALCASLGHEVEEVSWPEMTRPGEIIGVISGAHTARKIDQRLAALGRALRPGDLDAATVIVVENGRTITLERYLAAVDAMHGVGRAITRLTSRFDVLLTPSMAIVPPAIGVLDPNGPDPLGALRGMRGMGAFTGLFNVTGQPAMSMPLGRTSDGLLPLGVQFAGRYGDEATLFRLAGQLEAAAPWTLTAPAAG